MADTFSTEKSPESPKVMRLKVMGSSSIVNTIKDQQTARGLTLVCPFPTLEVDIPIEFGDKSDPEMQSGTIHRIGVEDDLRIKASIQHLLLTLCLVTLHSFKRE